MHAFHSNLSNLNRRTMLSLTGTTLAGVTLFGLAGDVPAQDAEFPGIRAEPGGHKPTYLPASDDPVAHSIAENLFWNEQLLEHTVFFLMLMPGDELAPVRVEVEKFQEVFTARLAASKSVKLDRGSLAAFNRTSIDEAKRFAEFKHKQGEAQATGKIRSLVWPSFFHHTALEAEYFATRLARLSTGDVSVERASALNFWTQIMGDHAAFVAHLLDPQERALIKTANEASEGFENLREKGGDADKALDATEALLGFKVVAEKGIDTGKIKSIIHPTLADHVRREAIKGVDELKRVA